LGNEANNIQTAKGLHGSASSFHMAGIFYPLQAVIYWGILGDLTAFEYDAFVCLCFHLH
jgi:hypothetical protein